MWGVGSVARLFAARQHRLVSVTNYSSLRAFCAPLRLRPLVSRDIKSCWKKGRCASSSFDRSQKRSPISWTSLALLLVGGGIAVVYVRYLKAEKEKEAEKAKTRAYGKAALGGPFSLTDHNGERKEHTDFLGKWVLLYFGFTFCPDICPEELEKMSAALNIIEKTPGLPEIQPLFVTVDPKRDSPAEIKKYLKEFHPRLLGLTGTPQEVEQITKAYRVYYSIGPTDNENDYLVDHTIIMYLIDPDGKFREYYGQNRTAEEIAASVANYMLRYKMNQ